MTKFKNPGYRVWARQFYLGFPIPGYLGPARKKIWIPVPETGHGNLKIPVPSLYVKLLHLHLNI